MGNMKESYGIHLETSKYKRTPSTPPPNPPMKKTRPLWVHVVSPHWLEMNPISNCIDHHA